MTRLPAMHMDINSTRGMTHVYKKYSLWTKFQRLRDHVKFATITTLVAFILGLYWYTIPFAADHIYFFISAPIATYFPSLLAWKLTFKSQNGFKIGRVIGLSVMLTLLCHYLNFVVLGVGRLIESLFSDNVEGESLFETVTYISWLRMTISLYHVGLITLILFVLTGVFVIKSSTKENTRQNN